MIIQAVGSSMECISGVTALGSIHSYGSRSFPTTEQTEVFQLNKEGQASLEHLRSKRKEPATGVIE